MTSQALSQNQDTRTAANQLLEKANQQYNASEFDAALKSYQEAQNVYQKIGEKAVATPITHFQTKISTVPSTEESVRPGMHFTVDSGIIANPPIMNGPK